MKFPIADAHCDFLYGAMEYGYDINTLRRDQVIHLPYMQQGNVKMQFFACWYDAKLKTPPLQQGLTMVDCYNRMLRNNPGTHQGHSKSRQRHQSVYQNSRIGGQHTIKGQRSGSSDSGCET